MDERFSESFAAYPRTGTSTAKGETAMAILGNRRNTKRNLGFLVLTSAALALGATGTCSAATADNAGSGLSAPIEGTWIMQVHRVAQNYTFTAFQSFTAGGVTLATGTGDRLPPPPISPLYGTWKRIGENSYANSLSFFIFDPAGNAVAMFQNYETFHLNRDNEIVGTGEGYVCEPNGDNCVNINSPITFTGKLMNAQHP
jgi:hypothetical protein